MRYWYILTLLFKGLHLSSAFSLDSLSLLFPCCQFSCYTAAHRCPPCTDHRCTSWCVCAWGQSRVTTGRAHIVKLNSEAGGGWADGLRFWGDVAALCSSSFHLSISFSTLVLAVVIPGPRWSVWYLQQTANPWQSLCDMELLQPRSDFPAVLQRALRFVIIIAKQLYAERV